ncbi:MAG: FtsQ-type POTRA domain-containing protein [Ruminococcaceae bacterium]|nr:FtsQ-type POTRA domain-containing protein [Oscillospiraceae bacterium]
MLSKFERKFGKDRPWGGHRRMPLPLKKAVLYIGIILAAMAIIGAILLVCGAIRISSVSVRGVTLYDADQVSRVAELKKGSEYWGFDPSRTEDKLKSEMPYIKDVKVRRHLNGSVSITVTEESNFYYTRHNVNYYLFSGDTWRVIVADYQPNTFMALGAVYLELPDDARIRVGEKLSFEYSLHVDDTAEVPKEEATTPEGDANEYYEYVFDVINTANSSDFKGRISHIGVSDRYDIYIALGGNVKVALGTTDELERKLEEAYIVYSHNYEKVISEGFVGAIIEAADPTKTSFRETLELYLPQ